MKVMLVEDEGVAARRLQRLLEAEGLEVVVHCKSNKSIGEYLDHHPEPALYFMDIHLNDGIVFELLQQRDLKSPIIFTTAYDQYAIKAFKQNSVDYLLKPIQEDELRNAIDKFKKLHQTTSAIDMKALSQLILTNQTATASYKERISVKIGERIKSFPITEITHVYSENKITFIHTAEGRSYPIDYGLEAFSSSLNPKKFFKINRGQMVSIDYIGDVITYSNSRLKIKIPLAEKQEFIVARERVKEFKNWLG